MTILYIAVYISHTRIFCVDVGTWIIRIFGIVEIMILSNPLCDSTTPFSRCGVVSCGCPPIYAESGSSCPYHREVESFPCGRGLKTEIVFRLIGSFLESIVIIIAIYSIIIGVGIDVITIPDLVFSNRFPRLKFISGCDHIFHPCHIFFCTDHTGLRSSLRVYAAIRIVVRAIAMINVP